MKKFLPGNKTIKSLFYIATIIIVVNFIFWEDSTSESVQKNKDSGLSIESIPEIINLGYGTSWEPDLERVECHSSFAFPQITKINQSIYNFGNSLTSDFIVEPIYTIFTSINAP